MLKTMAGVHDPLEAPEECIARYSHIANEKRRTYAGMVSCMDDAIGEVIQMFKNKGLWDNTILIWTSG